MCYHMVFCDEPEKDNNQYCNKATLVEFAELRSMIAKQPDSDSNSGRKDEVGCIEYIVPKAEVICFHIGCQANAHSNGEKNPHGKRWFDSLFIS